MENKSISLEGINTIIFDLGVVIINLDMEATELAFRRIFTPNYHDKFLELKSTNFFEDYETGKISTETFVDSLVKIAPNKTSRLDIINAWNAMLKDIPPLRFELLLKAKRQFRTFCLSNTNELHIAFIYNYLQNDFGIENLDSYFEKVYLSQEMGKRKPNADIYQQLIKEQSLDSNKILFIDDNKENILGARKLGINSYWLEEGETIEEVLVL